MPEIGEGKEFASEKSASVQKSALEIVSKSGFELAYERESAEFWIQERLALGKRVYDSVNEVTEKFGCTPLEFNPEGIVLVKKRTYKKAPKAGERPDLAGWHNSRTGDIFLDMEDAARDDSNFLWNLCHEALHKQSLVLPNDPNSFRRIGLVMPRKQFSHIEMGNTWLDQKITHFIRGLERKHPKTWKRNSMEFLDEAIVDYSTYFIMIENFRDIETSWVFRYGGYDFNRVVMRRICEGMGSRTGSGSEGVFKLFQKSVFGHGRALELGRLIENTYGKGSFWTFADLVDDLGKSKGRLGTGNPYERAEKIPEFHKLMDFLKKKSDQSAIEPSL